MPPGYVMTTQKGLATLKDNVEERNSELLETITVLREALEFQQLQTGWQTIQHDLAITQLRGVATGMKAVAEQTEPLEEEQKDQMREMAEGALENTKGWADPKYLLPTGTTFDHFRTCAC